MSNAFNRILRLAAIGGMTSAASCSPPRAQNQPYTDSLLVAARNLTHAVPGDLPTALRFSSFASSRYPGSDAVAGIAAESVSVAFPVFQVRYPHGWIIVDAGMDREIAGAQVSFSQERYDSVQQALRQASLILVTHEHHDHVAGVIRSPDLADVASKTLLTRAQVETLEERPDMPALRLDSAAAGRYLTVDYDRLLPVAPGVVLIKAPGHSPGSQMVYVRLASGREALLVGDIAWLMAGIQQRRQKPESTSRQLGEDRAAIEQQISWLSALSTQTGVAVLPCHDAVWLALWRRRGYLEEGLDLSGRADVHP